MIDYLIVGGGYSGIAFSWELEKRNISYKLADPFSKNSATYISGGLINPVTGRKYGLQWNIEELITLVKKEYGLLEDKFKTKFLFETDILKVHKSESSLEEWLKAKGNNALNPFISENYEHKNCNRFVDFRFGAITIKNALRIDAESLSTHYFNFIKEKRIPEKINYENLQNFDDHFEYNNEKFKNIIFCEGVAALNNPWFKNVPFKPAKGECLIIEIPNFTTKIVINKGLILIPFGGNKFWAGATNSWDDMTLNSTEIGLSELRNGLDELLKVPYVVLETKVAIRPTIRDRAPVVGRHPENSNLYILNGMGTKGASLSTYYAQKLFNFIEYNAPIPLEADIKRFYDLFRK